MSSESSYTGILNPASENFLIYHFNIFSIFLESYFQWLLKFTILILETLLLYGSTPSSFLVLYIYIYMYYTIYINATNTIILCYNDHFTSCSHLCSSVQLCSHLLYLWHYWQIYYISITCLCYSPNIT